MSLLLSLLTVSSFAPLAHAAPLDDRELIVHGFRAPVTGIELRDGPFGFHLGVYPTILGDEDVTTWFTKVGVSTYFLSFPSRSGRLSGFYASGSLLQGLSGAHDVTQSLDDGTAFAVDAGFRWAVGQGLDLRLGGAVLWTAVGEVYLNPTPGLSWSVPLGRPPEK